ncbi:FkbM family methyltransferase [Magnetospirillum molischianum]|uniref:Putative Methyltransferase, FkbM family n=1 Tax=Magnetospirillum molischianum DSM 120 TaxID=1150626 RepID=H8FSP2_MAGML|nr:FkbM family methyltransferase [Magnetospirillum molischianum]CCG41380.1 putative Methyltransferase, FkbM family [Magnetospirillum molischianum DSM 120]
MSALMSLRRRWHQFRKLLFLLPVPLFRRGLRHGVAATVEHWPLLSTLTMATVVDVGANRGQFSLLARALWPQATIHAFEPEVFAATTLERLMADDSRFHSFQLALGASHGFVPLFVSHRSDNSSLLPAGELQLRYCRGAARARTDEVALERLDSVLSASSVVAPALLKLDVQGGELAVLEGAEKIIDRFSHVLVEVSFVPLYTGQPLAGAVDAWLNAHGFRLAGLGEPGRDAAGRAVQVDLLFVKEA